MSPLSRLSYVALRCAVFCRSRSRFAWNHKRPYRRNKLVAHKAEVILDDFAMSRDSLEARICYKVSLASMSERVRMYSITPCS
jgi:hypothetical protein